MNNIKKLIRKFKRYDLTECETLQRISRNLRDYIKQFTYYSGRGNFEQKKIYAKLAIANICMIHDNYPLETYIAVYSIYEDELGEINEFLDDD